MRIIAGKFRGRKLSPPIDNDVTRPTTDMARESLFNILNNRFEFDDIKVLELFGGTGAHSFEFISRGTTDVTYVDKNPACVAFVKKTSALLETDENLRIFQMDVFKFVEMHKEKYDFIFADPPYSLPGLDLIPNKILENQLLKEDGLLILEHGQTANFKNHQHCHEIRNYGKTYFSFFKNEKREEV